jgi:hypothetical protein
MSKIQAGDGWRLIDTEKDTPREGDEFYYWGKWQIRPYPLKPFSNTETYRRRIPAKPEAMEIGENDQLHLIPDNFGDVEIHQGPDWILLSETPVIRKLGEWLISVADWREAQDSVAKTPPN